MGFENRDYTREGDYTGTLSGWGLDYLSPVVKWLIVANVVVFVLQIFLTRAMTPADIQERWDRLPPQMQEMYREADEQQALYEQSLTARRNGRVPADESPAGAEAPSPKIAADKSGVPAESFAEMAAYERVCLVNEWFELQTSQVIRGQIWRLVTAAFLHDRGGIFHILFNMLALFWFGVTLESMYGGKEFLMFYLAGAVAASLAHVGLDLYLGSSTPAVGASGAVMAVLMVYAIHYPRSTIRIFWYFPLEVRWIVLLYILFDLHPVLRALAGDPAYHDGIAHAAHLGGLAWGFTYWKFHLNLEQYSSKLPSWGARSPGFRRASAASRPRSPQRQLDDEVDEILAKISTSGPDSLTDHERRVLERASERYKRKHG